MVKEKEYSELLFSFSIKHTPAIFPPAPAPQNSLKNPLKRPHSSLPPVKNKEVRVRDSGESDRKELTNDNKEKTKEIELEAGEEDEVGQKTDEHPSKAQEAASNKPEEGGKENNKEGNKGVNKGGEAELLEFSLASLSAVASTSTPLPTSIPSTTTVTMTTNTTPAPQVSPAISSSSNPTFNLSSSSESLQSPATTNVSNSPSSPSSTHSTTTTPTTPSSQSLLFPSPDSSSNSKSRVLGQFNGLNSLKPILIPDANNNFNLLIGDHQVSMVVLKHQGVGGRHKDEPEKFYFQARTRYEYPQKHLWSGWATKEEAAMKVAQIYQATLSGEIIAKRRYVRQAVKEDNHGVGGAGKDGKRSKEDRDSKKATRKMFAHEMLLISPNESDNVPSPSSGSMHNQQSKTGEKKTVGSNGDSKTSNSHHSTSHHHHHHHHHHHRHRETEPGSGASGDHNKPHAAEAIPEPVLMPPPFPMIPIMPSFPPYIPPQQALEMAKYMFPYGYPLPFQPPVGTAPAPATAPTTTAATASNPPINPGNSMSVRRTSLSPPTSTTTPSATSSTTTPTSTNPQSSNPGSVTAPTFPIMFPPGHEFPNFLMYPHLASSFEIPPQNPSLSRPVPQRPPPNPTSTSTPSLTTLHPISYYPFPFPHLSQHQAQQVQQQQQQQVQQLQHQQQQQQVQQLQHQQQQQQVQQLQHQQQDAQMDMLRQYAEDLQRLKMPRVTQVDKD